MSITGQDHDAFSIYGELNFHVTDQLTLTAGGRYTDEKKKADIASLVFNVNSPCNVVIGGPTTSADLHSFAFDPVCRSVSGSPKKSGGNSI